MKLSCVEKNDEVLFKISGYDKKYVPVFEMCFYQKGEGFYYKSFPKTTRHINRIQENFIHFGPEMFSQLGYFTEIPWQEALVRFLKKVKDKPINWWLTGSCAACIRGIPFEPHDVDIMVDSRDLLLVEEVFAEDIIEPIRDTSGWVTKDFGVLFLGARVDIASDPSPVLDQPQPVDCGPYALAHLETIRWKGYEIKVPPLELQLTANKLRKRQDRVILIEEFLQINKQYGSQSVEWYC